MLESGVDRIITQVVDPKMNHTFRPHIETAIHDFLSGERKEENALSSNSALLEQTEPQEAQSASGPKTPWSKSKLKNDLEMQFRNLYFATGITTRQHWAVLAFSKGAATGKWAMKRRKLIPAICN